MSSLKKVEKLRAELNYLGPLKKETELQVMQQILFDWNYNAVTAKSNSLTLEETKALLTHGIARGSKPLRNYIEMKIHNDMISSVFELANLGIVFTEDFIKQIHESILPEPYEIESYGDDGRSIIKMVEIGKYKQTPNTIWKQDGRILSFATPEETPGKMKELVKWYTEKSQEKDVNPIELAAELHYRFIKIQPFDDANSRIAQILTNLILIQNGYPPIVILKSEKYIYHYALQRADTGKLESFVEFIAGNVAKSLELFIRGGKGEKLEEPDKLERDLMELEEKMRKLSSRIVKRDKVSLLNLYDKSLYPLINKLLENYSKFDRFYIEKKLYIEINSLTNLGTVGNGNKKSRTAKSLNHLRELLLNEPLDLNPEILITYSYSNINRNGFSDVAYSNQIVVHFDELEYMITESNNSAIHSNYVKKYSETLSIEEIEETLNKTADIHKSFIERKVLDLELSEEILVPNKEELVIA